MGQTAILERLKGLGIELPEPVAPVGAYVPYKRIGNTIWTSGMIPLKAGKLLHEGRAGAEVTLEEAQECAKLATINALSWLSFATNGFQSVKGVVRMNGYVASAEGFFDQAKVLNAASEVLVEVFGPDGKHTRVAVGVPMLPLNAPVELDFVFELE